MIECREIRNDNGRLVGALEIDDGVLKKFMYAEESRDIEFALSEEDLAGVTSIGEQALQDLMYLRSIEIPNSVTSIGEWAFNCFISLVSVEIPYGVTSIGEGAFFNCYSIASIVIPNSVTSIGENAFMSCGGLASIEIPNSVTGIAYGAFIDCSSLTSIVIPNSVTSIGEHAFQECDALETIVISENIIDHLSAPGIFPKPLHEYKIIVKKLGKPVKYIVDRYKTKDIEDYKEKAIEVCEKAKAANIMQVIVRFTIPEQLYPLNIVGMLVPLKIRQEVRALVLSFIRLRMPNVAQVQICRCIISELGINEPRELDYECKFDSKCNESVISKISSSIDRR